jgi:hypothetical protein
MSDPTLETRIYHIMSTSLVNGPGMMDNFKYMWETGDEALAIELMAACFPNLPIGLCYGWLSGSLDGSIEENVLILEY